MSTHSLSGVRKALKVIGQVYAFRGAKQNLHVVYPDAEHDFPADIRAEVYDWLDRALNR